jgi:hypothetical protein
MQPHDDESGRSDPWESRMARRAPAWLPPLPASIVAVGNPEQPLEQLMTLQSAIARFVQLATVAGRLRPKLRFSALPSFHFR